MNLIVQITQSNVIQRWFIDEQQRIQPSSIQGKANPEIYVILESESNKSKDHKYNPDQKRESMLQPQQFHAF